MLCPFNFVNVGDERQINDLNVLMRAQLKDVTWDDGKARTY